MEQTVDETRHLLITLHGRDRSSGLQQRCRRAVIGDLEEWRFEWVGQLWETLVGALRRRAGAGRWRGPSDRTELSAVFAPGVGGTVVHEAVGHLFEADVTSGPRGMPGARIASDRLTVVDDATLPDLWGTRRIDDEGRTCRPLTLIHAGRFGELLHSRDTDPARSTSARRGSYTCAPLPRMSNTYLAAGSDRTEDLMDGPLVLHCLDGGAAEVRPGSGDVLVRIRFAQLLRGGIPVADHRDLLLQVAAADLMDRIEGVGPAVHFEAARCRKEGQSVPVAHGAPAFRLPVTVLR
jgi:TldD protein